MAMSALDRTQMKQQLEKTDEKLRQKYQEVVQSLDLDELKHFNKMRYKEMAITDFTEQHPDADKKDIDSYAQCLCNFLQSEARDLKNAKMQKQLRRSNRKSTQVEPPQSAKTQQLTCDNLLTESVLENLNDTFGIPTATEIDTEVSDTFVQALNDTLRDPNDTLSSTFNASELDDTYDANQTLDNSITELKRALQTTNSNQDKPNNKTGGHQSSQGTQKACNAEDDDILCTDTCSGNVKSGSIRCNLCFTWYHTKCVGIKNINSVDAWVCADCRALPKIVKILKTQVATLINTVETLSEKIENKFENLNDRLTTLSNQNKSSSQSCTSSLSDIHQEIQSFRNEMDKKSNTLISKNQLIIDQMKSQPVPVNHAKEDQTNTNSKQKSKKTKQKKANSKHTQKITDSQIVIDVESDSESQTSDSNISTEAETHQNKNTQSQNKASPTPTPAPKSLKRDLVFITGSEILQNINTRYLNKNVRVKSFKGATIDDLKSQLASMDLTRYQNTILHIGGNDIDANISLNSFREKYHALLTSVKSDNNKVTVSGLLPRRGLNIRPFNDSPRDLCKSLDIHQ